MAGTIQNLEVFAVGTWTSAEGRTTTFTEQDLDEMVDSFHALNQTNIVKPHLKLGHQDAQKWFGQKTGIHALGWVERLWRNGQKLMADVSNIPESLLDLIKQKRYHNVSIEILPKGKIEHDGKKFGYILSAVALLGTEMPAVKDLAGLASALFSEQPVAFADGVEPSVFTSTLEKNMFTQEQVDALVEAAVSKATATINAKFSSDATAKDTQISVLTQRAEGAEKQVSTLAAKLAYSDHEKIVDEAIKVGKLLPKQKERAMAFMAIETKMSFGGAEKSAAVLFSEFLADAQPVVKLGEQGTSDGQEAGKYATAAAEVHSLTMEAIKTAGGPTKLSYNDAMDFVLSNNADLKTRYSFAQ